MDRFPYWSNFQSCFGMNTRDAMSIFFFLKRADHASGFTPVLLRWEPVGKADSTADKAKASFLYLQQGSCYLLWLCFVVNYLKATTACCCKAQWYTI